MKTITITRIAALFLATLTFFAGYAIGQSPSSRSNTHPVTITTTALHEQVAAGQAFEIRTLRGLKQEAQYFNWDFQQQKPISSDPSNCFDMVAFYNSLTSSLQKSGLSAVKMPKRLSYPDVYQTGPVPQVSALGTTYAWYAQTP